MFKLFFVIRAKFLVQFLIHTVFYAVRLPAIFTISNINACLQPVLKIFTELTHPAYMGFARVTALVHRSRQTSFVHKFQRGKTSDSSPGFKRQMDKVF
jgi:hypothetical protein